MSSHLRVSVIIPTYNRRELVQRAIQSALAQTFRPLEILVVDDGSTDGTAELVGSLPDPVHLWQQSNQGLAAARNAGIRRSRGDLIALLDSDDQWTPDKLARSVALLDERPECDVVYNAAAALSSSGRLQPPARRRAPDGWILNTLFERNFICDSSTVFHRRVWERIGGFDETLPVCVGHQFWLRVAVGHRFGYLPEPLTICGESPESLTADRARLLRVQAEMLHRFYEEQGWQRMDRSRVCQTMNRLCLKAGQLTWRQGDIALSARHYRGAVLYRPTMRSRLWFAFVDYRRKQAGLPAIETPVLR